MRNSIMNKVVVLVFLNVSVFIAGRLPEAWASPVRGPFPADITIRENVEVLLRFPYEVILRDEAITGYFAIRNFSDEPLAILDSPLLYDVYKDGQIIYEFRSSSDSPVISEAPTWPDWELITSRNPLKHLGKNEYVWHDIDRIGYAVRMAPAGTREARVGFITGPNEWVFSEWTPVRRNDERVADGKVLLEFVIDRLGGPLIQGTVRVCTVQDDDYIFFQRYRIARVPEGATPRAVWNNETGHLTIHFDGVDVPAAVFRVRRPVEWTPETVPHMQVLEELKAELESARDAEAPTREPEPVTDPPAEVVPPEPEAIEDTVSPASPPQSTEDTPTEPATDPTPARTWPVLLVLLLVAGGTALVLKHKRQR